MIVYKIENKINGKIYIGQTKNSLSNRVKNHLRNSSFIGKALRKYGMQSFNISVIDSADSKKVLNEKELYWIKTCNSEIPNGYNILQGGSYSVGFSGKKHTEESLQKMRDKQRGTNNGMYGRKHSEEARTKIGNAEKGFKHSEETKKKMSVARLGKHWKMSEEGRKNLRKPRSEAGRLSIKNAANDPARIQKIKDAWVIRRQKNISNLDLH